MSTSISYNLLVIGFTFDITPGIDFLPSKKSTCWPENGLNDLDPYSVNSNVN